MFADGINPGVDNNIVIAHQVGLGGVVGPVKYSFTGTYSRNYGATRLCATESCSSRTSNVTDRKDQYSVLLQMSMPVQPKLSLNFDLAYDTGELYADQLGGMVSVMYDF
jgi:hypothetical protein